MGINVTQTAGSKARTSGTTAHKPRARPASPTSASQRPDKRPRQDDNAQCPLSGGHSSSNHHHQSNLPRDYEPTPPLSDRSWESSPTLEEPESTHPALQRPDEFINKMKSLDPHAK